jgi:hypothetical protein
MSNSSSNFKFFESLVTTATKKTELYPILKSEFFAIRFYNQDFTFNFSSLSLDKLPSHQDLIWRW